MFKFSLTLQLTPVITVQRILWSLGGAVASWLVRSSPDQAVRIGSSNGRGNRVVFLGKTRYSHSASLHPGV